MNIEFTKNHTEVRDKISSIYADYRWDLPEEVVRVFESVLEKNWKSYTKFIVFVADAPGHGLKYTDDDYNYPDGIAGRKDIEESVRELTSKNVLMFCLRIDSYTDKMFSFFKNVYQEYGKNKLQIVDQYSYDNKNYFTDEVVKSAVNIYKTQRENINIEKAVEYLINHANSEAIGNCANMFLILC